MNGKVKYLVGTAAGALLLIGTALPSFAADPTATPTPGAAYCQMGAGLGVGGGRWGFGSDTLTAVSKLFGMDAGQVVAARQSGQSLAQIGQSKNPPVSEATIVSAILADRQATLDARVKAGTLSQEQADLMLQRMETQVKADVERTTVGPNGAGLGMGPGGRGMGLQNGTGPMGQAALMGGGFGARMGR